MPIGVQKSRRVRIIKFIIGGFLVGFSVYRFLNITNISPLWATYPGIAVLVIGIIDILKGFLSKADSKITRTIEASIGIIAILVGLLVVYISDTSSKFISFIFLFLIIQGIGFIAEGVTQGNKSKVIRIPKIIIGGGINMTLIGTFFEYHDLPITVITILLSINLFMIGIEIISSAFKHKVVKSS